MRVEKSPQTVFTVLADGTAVLLNLETLFYYELNRTGAVLWQEIEANSSPTVERLVSTVCDRFDVKEEGARPAIMAFVSRLAEFKMVRIV
jgi:coenzyme PQQ synthesis protein D (PqqD)